MKPSSARDNFIPVLAAACLICGCSSQKMFHNKISAGSIAKLIAPTPVSGDAQTQPSPQSPSANPLPSPAVSAAPVSIPVVAELSSITSHTVTISLRARGVAEKYRVWLCAEPAGGTCKTRILLGEPAAIAESFLVAGLIPSMKVFLQVDALVFNSVYSQLFVANTSQANDTDKISEAHLVSPQIIQINMPSAAGFPASGTGWIIQRANGSTLALKSISRSGMPASARHYDVGFSASSHDDLVDFQQSIFLTLNENIGQQEVLQITSPAGEHFLFPFSDLFNETPAVQLNQVGYNPLSQRRYAYVSAWLGEAGAMKLDSFPQTANLVSEGAGSFQPPTMLFKNIPLQTRSNDLSETGLEVGQIDLSALRSSEDLYYRVQIPGVGLSWKTTVSDSVSYLLFYTAMRGLYHNRFGGKLDAAYTSWFRPVDGIHTSSVDHPFSYTSSFSAWQYDNNIPAQTPLAGLRALDGGYHEGASFTIRPVQSVVPRLLMRVFEMSPDKFVNAKLHLPESGNGIPDILNEALWGVRIWENLQEADGGVRAGVQSSRPPQGIFFANLDQNPLWTLAEDANQSARAAGLFAKAARLVAPFDAAHSQSLLAKARAAYAFASAQHASAFCFLSAAGELLLTTGEVAFKTDFESAWNQINAASPAALPLSPGHMSLADYSNGLSGAPTSFMADEVAAYLKSPKADAALSQLIQQKLTAVSNATLQNIERHAYLNARPPNGTPGMGNSAHSSRFLNAALTLYDLGGYSADTQQKAYDAVSLSADWLLGANPAGIVFLSGMGTRSAVEVNHPDSLAWLAAGKAPIAGLAVAGSGDDVAVSTMFYPDASTWPQALRYADLRLLPGNTISSWQTQIPAAEIFSFLMTSALQTE